MGFHWFSLALFATGTLFAMFQPIAGAGAFIGAGLFAIAHSIEALHIRINEPAPSQKLNGSAKGTIGSASSSTISSN